VALAFAREGAHVALSYLDENDDARETRRRVEDEEGGRCLLLPGDVSDEAVCRELVATTVGHYGGLHVLVNNAGEQHPQERMEDVSAGQVERTFRTNVFSMFHLVRAALPHLGPGSSILNTTSVTAYNGNPALLDYSATKGAVVAYTRALAAALVDRGIRVNGVAPGPVWTPLIPATFDADHVARFGSQAPMGRPGQPNEIAPCYVFLASEDASYMTGQVLHPNGGTPVGG
jgi:NAD(P)-dependent dehydrogenase (short-subunit alcohol dehydrogenase family)